MIERVYYTGNKPGIGIEKRQQIKKPMAAYWM